ncbi:MAG TPA: pilus assembly protein PilP [Nitrospiria bacterium]|nr:pilus assembly protein PilP [Nitrospiria bacterium]
MAMIFNKRQMFFLVAGIVLASWVGCSKESSSPNQGNQVPPTRPAANMPGTAPGANMPPSAAVPQAKKTPPGTSVPQVKGTAPATAVPPTVGGKKVDEPGAGPVSVTTPALSGSTRPAHPELSKTTAAGSATLAGGMAPKPALTAASSGTTQSDNKAALQMAQSNKRPDYDSGGRKDPFIPYYMLEDTKGRKASFPLLNYKLEELKLTVIIKIGKQRYYAMMQTPDGKGYTVKVGMEIGSAHGKIKEITDQTLKVEEEIQEDNEKKKREVVFSLHSPEEGKS